MNQIFVNNLKTTLGSALGASATTVTLATGAGAALPVIAAPYFAMLTLEDVDGLEIVRVTAHAADSDTLTVLRAQEGTVARAFSVGARVEMRFTAGTATEWDGALTSARTVPARPDIVPPMQRLLVFYGYPIAFRGIWNANNVIDAIASKYDIYVVGDTYQDPGFSEYASTCTIAQGLRKRGVLVYGYVPIGSSGSGRTMAQMKTQVDQWATVGVDGIFLDEFGFDYGNTRARQAEIVDYVHSKGLNYCANAWNSEDALCDTYSEIPADMPAKTDETTGTLWKTKNPDGKAIARRPGDSFMVEDFCFGNALPLVFSKSAEVYLRKIGLGDKKNMRAWCLSVMGESPAGTLDPAKTGGMTATQIGQYISAMAYICGANVLGVGGYSFGSGGTNIELVLPSLPAHASYATPPRILPDGKTITRGFGNCALTVKNNSVVSPASTDITTTYQPIGVTPQFETVPEAITELVFPAWADGGTAEHVLPAGYMVDSNGSSETPASGTVWFMYFRALKNRTITKICLALGGRIPSSVTNAWVGLYSVASGDALTLESQSADLGASFGAKWAVPIISLATPVTITAGRMYAVAILEIGTTTNTYMSITDTSQWDPVGQRLCGKKTGQSSLPATITNPSKSELLLYALVME